MVKYNLMDQIGQQPKAGRAVKQLLFTKKPDALYAITTGWLAPRVTLRNVKAPANPQVTMLGVEGVLRSQVHGKNLEIEVPPLPPQRLPCRHNFTFKIPGAELLTE